MLKPTAFANSITIILAVFYVAVVILKSTAPALFNIFFNAQFIGADIAPLVPDFSLASFIINGVFLLLFTWVFMYCWIRLYNKLVK